MENQISGDFNKGFDGKFSDQPFFPSSEKTQEETGDVGAFKKFGLIAIIFGLLHTFCLYKNTSGITYPFYMAGTMVLIALARKSEGMSIFKNREGKSGLNLFYIISLMLLSISKCTTANTSLLWIDGFAIYLLTFSFLLYMCADTMGWDIISYFVGILITTISPLAKFVDPIVDSTTWFKTCGKGVSTEKKKTLIAVLSGIIIAVPLLIIVLMLLASADAIFDDVLNKVTSLIRLPENFWDIVGMGFLFLFAYWVFYTVAKVLSKDEVKINNKNCGFNPVTAITFSSLLGAVYLLFSVIQIVFLFADYNILPEKYTYAEYAREGFYQLLAVSIMNFILVTICQKLFADSKVLKAILLVIGLCTYVMIASSAFRMFMYIWAYNLTFLRVFVLWFLAVLAICLAFLIVSLFNKNFQVYKCCMVTVTVLYLAFAFAHPDYHIAKYDLAQIKIAGDKAQIDRDTELSENPMNYYLTHEISEDAVPAYADYPELLETYDPDYYFFNEGPYWEEYKEVRKFNFSRYKARNLCRPYQLHKD